MFKWLSHFLIFATSGKYQNKEKPLKRQRKLGLDISEKIDSHTCTNIDQGPELQCLLVFKEDLSLTLIFQYAILNAK